MTTNDEFYTDITGLHPMRLYVDVEFTLGCVDLQLLVDGRDDIASTLLTPEQAVDLARLLVGAARRAYLADR